MAELTSWAPGDPCPGCGGALTPRRAATRTEFDAFTDRENPKPLPPGVDNANPAQRAELGELHVCGNCGYKARHKATAAGEVVDDGKPEAGRPTATRARAKRKPATSSSGE